jgi:hypothetical protein
MIRIKSIIIFCFILSLLIINVGCVEKSDTSNQSPNNPEDNDGDNDGGGNNDNNKNNDKDGDGIIDNEDEFPNDPDEWIDSDGDGIGDNGDAFPEDPNEWQDSDEDGYGDNSDEFPYNHNEWEDSDDDGIGDNSDEYPNDPYSLYNGSDVWELNDVTIYAKQDIKGSFEFNNIQLEVDYLVWEIVSDQNIDLLIIDPTFDHVYHEVGTEFKGKYEVEITGTWEIQLVYNGAFPPRTIINGIAYQII